MAMVSCNKFRIKFLARNDNRRASIILFLLNNPHRLFGTTLLGINLATILATYAANFYFHNYISKYIIFIEDFIPLELLILLIMEPVVLIFGELYPMSIARKYPNSHALKNAFLIKIFSIILYPLMIIPNLISKTISKLFKKMSSSGITRKELELLVTGSYTNVTKKTKEYMKDMFDIRDLTAEDVMVHLINVTAISEEATVGELKEIINSTKFNRIPIYKKDIFNITATVHAINIIGIDDKEPVIKYSEKLYIVPSSKPIIKILSELKRNRKYMGIVVDEYGTVCGIISIKDILKEFVEDIVEENEYDLINENIEDERIFDAAMELDDFYEKTGIDLRNDDVDTLGGIINIAAGRIARKNEKITYKNVQFEVIDATDRVVKTVRLLN
jgi:putative hemolysin